MSESSGCVSPPAPSQPSPRSGECVSPPVLEPDSSKQKTEELEWRSVPECEPCVLESSYEEYGGKKAWQSPPPQQPLHGKLLPVDWQREAKDLLDYASDTTYCSSKVYPKVGWMQFPPLPDDFEAQVRKLLKTPATTVYTDDKMLGLEFPVPEVQVAYDAEYLRYHSTNITALQLAVKFGKQNPPARLAVGFSETGGSPGLYYSDNIGGCLMYTHGGLRYIGVTLILQAPAGRTCSSASNRVSYLCEQHCIRGAFIYRTLIKDNINTMPTMGQVHPLLTNRSRCGTMTANYKKYCLQVCGCNDQGEFFGQPANTTKELEEAVEREEPAPAASAQEKEEVLADAEER